MLNTNDKVIRNLRHMAWERARGELMSMLHTYWEVDDKYRKLHKAIHEFIELVEDNELHD